MLRHYVFDTFDQTPNLNSLNIFVMWYVQNLCIPVSFTYVRNIINWTKFCTSIEKNVFIMTELCIVQIRKSRMTKEYISRCPDFSFLYQRLNCLFSLRCILITIVWIMWINTLARMYIYNHCIPSPQSKVHGANMGPTWVLSAPDGPHVGPRNLAIRVVTLPL